MDTIKLNRFHTTDVKELAIDGTTVTASAAELNKLDGVTASLAEINKLDGVTATPAELTKLDGVTLTYDQINNHKCFALGKECAATAAGVVDFDTLDDTLYGFYTTEKITPSHIEHIVTEGHACDTVAGVVSITDGTLTYGTVTAVNGTAAHGHISGAVTAATYIAAGTMVYAKTTTETEDGGGKATAGEGYFLVFYD